MVVERGNDICSMLPAELEEYFAAEGEAEYRARQVFKWLRSGAASFGEMTNLPGKLRDKLAAQFRITAAEPVRSQISQRDGTAKYLWGMADGDCVESVVMKYSYGNTVCISTQAGCRMGCAFCASAIEGLSRNLTASEMEAQVLSSRRAFGADISHIVMMGIGEPLDNFDNVLRFLSLITHELGMNMSPRRVSLSTCGIIERIDNLAVHDVKLTLSVSLHAPDDETRSMLMPVNRAAGVDKLIEACSRYFEATGRRVSYEYALIDAVNDSPRQAHLLAEKLSGTGSHVNIILLNDVPERPLRASTPGNAAQFMRILKQKGVNYTVRRRLGADIEAACGQLRRKSEKQVIKP